MTVLDRPTAAPVRPAAGPVHVVQPSPAAVLRRLSRSLPEITGLAVVGLVAYTLLGWWLKYTYNFSLGDALARTADAKFMVASRDPHAAAIGLYWMPLPTASQVPAVYVLQMFGRAEFAGPLTSALWSAGTVLVLGRMARDFRLPRVTGFLLTLAYAANPVVVYYAANGMAEACEFFFIALTLRGLLRFLQDDAAGSALICGVGLAGLCMSKYEAVPALFAVTGVVAVRYFRRRRLRSTLMNLALIVLPAVWMLFLWFMYMKLITGSFFAFREVAATTQEGVGAGPGNPDVVSVIGNREGAFSFAWQFILAFFPAAPLLLPTLLVPPWRRTLGGLGVLAVGTSVIAATTYLVFTGGTFGNPRYFTPVLIVGAVTLVAVAGRVPLLGTARVWVDPVIIICAVATGFTATAIEAQATNSIEREARVFGILKGDYDPNPDYVTSNTDFSLLFREASGTVDRLLRPDDLVLIDTRFTSQVALYSDKPKQFIVNADRDYEIIVSPQGIEARIDYAVVPPARGLTGLPADRDEAALLVGRQPGWTKIYSNPVAEIWQRSDEFKEGTIEPPGGSV